MKRANVWVLAGLIAAAGPAWGAEETRTVAAFNAVEFAGIGKMEISVGTEQSVTLVGTTKMLARVTTEVKDDALTVKLHDSNEGHNWLWRFVMPDDHDDDLTVKITVPHLNKIGVSGAAKIDARGIEGDAINFSVSGAAKIRADGHADKLALSIAGAGDANLDRLIVKDATISISGAGKADVHAQDNLNAEISGVGSVRYAGEPHVTSKISGAGSIKAR